MLVSAAEAELLTTSRERRDCVIVEMLDAPGADAMSLIHSKQSQGPFGVHGLECAHEALGAQQLRSDEEEPKNGTGRLHILQNAAALLSSLD